MKKTIEYIREKKLKGELIPRTALYDFAFAQIAEEAGIDIINVGDTISKYMMGLNNTNKVSMDLLIEHAKAVRKGAPNCFVMGDMPFLSYVNKDVAIKNAARFIVEAEVDAVKLEGTMEVIPIIEYLTNAGIPVIGHTGVKLQSRQIIGSEKAVRENFLKVSKAMEDAGAIAIVYTEVPLDLACENYKNLSIPIMAAGCGEYTDSPMINFYELVGLSKTRRSFAKAYGDSYNLMLNSAKSFVDDVIKKNL